MAGVSEAPGGEVADATVEQDEEVRSTTHKKQRPDEIAKTAIRESLQKKSTASPPLSLTLLSLVEHPDIGVGNVALGKH